jgi:hypothetical protein
VREDEPAARVGRGCAGRCEGGKISLKALGAAQKRNPASGITPGQEAVDRRWGDVGPAVPGFMILEPRPQPAPKGFGGPYDIPYGGRKLPSLSAALGLCRLRRGADLPQVGRVRRPWELLAMIAG